MSGTLRTPEEARDFVRARGVAVRTPDPWLPSIFAAAGGAPARPGKGGFGSWPAHAWWWGGVMHADGDILPVKVLKGRTAYVAKGVWPALDAAVRGRGAALAGTARALVDALAARGPTRSDDLRRATGLGAPARAAAFKKARAAVEGLGLVITLPAESEKHEHVALLELWETRFPRPLGKERGVDAFVRAAIGAAGAVPEKVVRGWFGWPREEVAEAVERLVTGGKVVRGKGGVLSVQ